ncbi:lysophospholipid acyltransferase family protein [Almyronema epifaneia]|uniref:Lysophospholipid acyltransferase family protein n=1 Tax=Almyronema epifaneia S1 TaxID=2991925 RepID=A0ABW6IHX5_9CYAN
MPDRDRPTDVSLTPDVLQRVAEGIEAGQSELIRWSVREAFEQFEQRAAGAGCDRRASGQLRRWVMRLFILTLFRVEVENLEAVPAQPAILAANHLGHLDPFLLLAKLPPEPYFYILGDARTLYNKWWKRWVLSWAGGVIPLDRWWKEEIAVMAAAAAGRDDLAEMAKTIEQQVPSGGDVRSLRQIDRTVETVLTDGDGILLFPEGRLGSQEGKLYPLKRGTVLYALRNGVPIVPVAIVGTQDLYLGKKLTIRFGSPLAFQQRDRLKRLEIDAALESLEEAMRQLLPTDYQEPPGPKLFRYLLNHLFW